MQTEIELVGYLLAALEDEEARHIEQTLQTNARVYHHLEILRLALVPLEADRDHVMPPAGLAARTCKRIRMDITSRG
jgi:hypothetical protein